MARSSPYAFISRRNRAIQDTWRANLAIKAPFSRRGPGNHAWHEDVASAARPFAAAVRARGPANWPNGPCALRPGPARLPHARPPAVPPAPPHRPHRVNQPGSAAACITLAALSTPIVSTRIVHRSRGGWGAAATRARGPPPIAAIHPRAPRLHACRQRRLRPPLAPHTAANERNRAASSMWA